MGRAKQAEERRPLTPAEQKRKEAFEAACARLEAAGYQRHDLTVGLVFANVMALVLGLPLIALCGVIFLAANPAPALSFGIGGVVCFLAACLFLIAVHELIHGITWAIFAKAHWRAISFGFIARYLTPYCTCREPLTRGAYALGGLMPALVLGVLPCLAAAAAGSEWLFLLGAVMLLAAGGDLTILLRLAAFRTGGREALFLDHPYQGGLVVLTR